MKSKEHLALDYIFYRNPSYYIITLFPIMAGLIGAFFVNDPLNNINRTIQYTSQQIQYDIIDTFLEATAVTLSFVISYFVIFKWALMKANGSYGFWLTQGLDRQKFFIFAVIKMSIIVILSYFIGIFFLISLGGVNLDLSHFIILCLLIVSNVLVIFSLAILTSELITDPELAATIFLSISSINLFFNTNHHSFLHRILLSDRHYADSDAWGVFFLAIISAGLILFGSLELHLKRSIDL